MIKSKQRKWLQRSNKNSRQFLEHQCNERKLQKITFFVLLMNDPKILSLGSSHQIFLSSPLSVVFSFFFFFYFLFFSFLSLISYFVIPFCLHDSLLPIFYLVFNPSYFLFLTYFFLFNFLIYYFFFVHSYLFFHFLIFNFLVIPVCCTVFLSIFFIFHSF